MLNEESYFTFWGHIEELRTTVLKLFLFIGLGFIVALWFYKSIFHFLIPPSSEHYIKEKLERERVFNPSLDAIMYSPPLGAQVESLQEGVQFMGNNYYRIQGGAYLSYETPVSVNKLLIINPLEGIMLSFKLSFWLGFAATSPCWVYVLLRFMMPALHHTERRIVVPFICSSFFFMLLGLKVAYTWTIPIANRYLEVFNSDIGENLWSLSHYIDYTLIVLLGHAVAFELCVILLFMVHFQFLKTEWLVSKRRSMIIFAFILGALLTPPDVLTQLLLALPLVAVYELAILYSRIGAFLKNPGKNNFQSV
jgi:sec-independent protein translocase protein TatC